MAALRASGTPASRMAVLLRINAQSERFEEALAARGLTADGVVGPLTLAAMGLA